MKKPRFFCDNCGTEVDSGENRCPNCGRYFSYVKCPKCGFTGEDSLFKNGCPSCSYSSEKPARNGGTAEKAPSNFEKNNLDIWLAAAIAVALLFIIVLLLF